jgi:hypothetical protein
LSAAAARARCSGVGGNRPATGCNPIGRGGVTGAGEASLSPKARRLRPVVKERLRRAIARGGDAGVVGVVAVAVAISLSPNARLLRPAVVKLRLRRIGAACPPSSRA